MDEPQQLGEILNDRLFVKCESCGVGFKMWDSNKQEYRKWCRRCVDVYHRKKGLKPEKAERLIQDTVEPLYSVAKLDDLAADLKDKLLALKYGQDVFMYGQIGTGKTYAMAALIRHYIYEGFECRRLNFDDFCVSVRATFSPTSKRTEEEIVEPLKWIVDKLFIDDLGLRSIEESNFVYGTFYSILNKRQERLLPTFITSNKSIDQLSRTFDARIASRLKPALIIELIGKDRREMDKYRPEIKVKVDNGKT